MLSFIQDALGSVSNLTKRNSGNGYTVENSEQNAEDMASKALENSINIRQRDMYYQEQLLP